MSGAERIWHALGIPDAALVDRRVPKARLVEGAELTPADRRLVEAGVERIDWRATLRPQSTAIPASADPPVAEIVVLLAQLRPRAGGRLPEILHRAVTAPLLLILNAEEGGRLSVGLKRAHEREAGRLVLGDLVTSPPVSSDETVDSPTGSFLQSLALARLPAPDLATALVALRVRVEAFAAAREAGDFRLPRDEAEAEARRAALARVAADRAALEKLRRAARGEKSVARRVALSHQVGTAEEALRRTLAALS